MDAYLLESGGQVPPYHVVSQVWGDIKEHLCLAGISWDVPISSRHKWDAIVAFCKRNNARWLWIDILCIDQTPESEDAQAEKAREIPNMSHYYRNAAACLVVPADYDTFSHSYSAVIEIHDTIIRHGLFDTEEAKKRLWLAIPSITETVHNPWFTRIWTYQELLLSEKHVLLDGQELRVDKLHAVVRWYEWAVRKKHLVRPEGCPQYEAVDADSELVLTKVWWLHTEGWNLKEVLRRNGHVDVMSLVVHNTKKVSTYEVDRLFGLYGMLSDDDKVAIDPRTLGHSGGRSALEHLWKRIVIKAVTSGRMWPLLNDVMGLKSEPGEQWMPVITGDDHWYGIDSGLHNETLSQPHRNSHPVLVSTQGLGIAARTVGKVVVVSHAIGAGSGDMGRMLLILWIFASRGFDMAPAKKTLMDTIASAHVRPHGPTKNELVTKDQEAMQAALSARSLRECGQIIDGCGLASQLVYGGQGADGLSRWNRRIIAVLPRGQKRLKVFIAWIQHWRAPTSNTWVLDVTSDHPDNVLRWVVANEVQPQVYEKIGTVAATRTSSGVAGSQKYCTCSPALASL